MYDAVQSVEWADGGQRHRGPFWMRVERAVGTSRRQSLGALQAATIASRRRERRVQTSNERMAPRGFGQAPSGGRGRLQAHAAGNELWPGGGEKKGLAGSSGRAEDRKKGPVEASQGMARDEGAARSGMRGRPRVGSFF
jgi:hypothetical protein